MRYLPKSPADRAAMLNAIGIRSVDDLFSPIPAEYRLKRDLAIPRQMAETEIVDWFRARDEKTATATPASSAPAPITTTARVVIDALMLARRVLHRLHALPAGDSPRAPCRPSSSSRP